MEAKKMYIDGEWVTGSMAKTFDVINPATGEVIDKVYESSVEDTRLAIAAAKKSFYETREWRDMDSQTRGDIILKIADLIEKYADELAAIGARFQLDASSVYTPIWSKLSKKLLKKGYISAIASDAHNVEIRTPEVLRTAYALIEKQFGVEFVRELKRGAAAFCES